MSVVKQGIRLYQGEAAWILQLEEHFLLSHMKTLRKMRFPKVFRKGK